MTGAEGGTHYQDKYPQKFRQELLQDVPPQAKSLLHLPLALIFHYSPPVAPRVFPRPETTANNKEAACD